MSAILVAGIGFGFSVVAMVLWFIRVQRVAIPDDRSLFLVLWVLGGGLGLASLFMDDAYWLSQNLGSLAIVMGWGILIFYVLAGQKASSPIEVGQKMPAFSALDETGVLFDSMVLEGKPVLIKFFRGHW